MDNNIITYAKNKLDCFSNENFNSVDSLILSWVSYMHFPKSIANINNWEGVRLADLFLREHFDEMFYEMWNVEGSLELFTALVSSPRFRDIRIMGFTEDIDVEKEKQFSAMTFQLTPEMLYVAFRGTDSTLVGWKEDFNMAFRYPVASQLDAEKYVAEVAKHCTGNIRIGGHSKGGNLAVASAINCSADIQNRIERIYSHDGPGFLESVLQSDAFIAIEPKIEKTLPQSSIIGMLLEHQEDYRIVKSNRFSIWQHDPFSWVVDDNDFCLIERLTPDARYLDQTLNSWIKSLSEEERERFVDALYGVLNTTNPTTFSELHSEWQKNIPAILRATSKLDEDTRSFIIQTVKSLISFSIKNVPEIFKK